MPGVFANKKSEFIVSGRDIRATIARPVKFVVLRAWGFSEVSILASGQLTAAPIEFRGSTAVVVSSSGSLSAALLMLGSTAVVVSSSGSLRSTLDIPVIETHPASRTVNDFGTVTFTVTYSGSPSTFQWQKNIALVGGSSWSNISGATSQSYTDNAVSPSDAGNYRVVVSNGAGSVTSNEAVLTVTPVTPWITSQPSNQSVSAGSSTTFTVVASGSTPFSYQWKKNTVNISGAISASYNIPSTVNGNEGNYTVLVTNSAGSVLSNAASLAVAEVPVITSQPVGGTAFPHIVDITGGNFANMGISFWLFTPHSTIVPGQSSPVVLSSDELLSLVVVAESSSPMTYAWKKDGIAVGTLGLVDGFSTLQVWFAAIGRAHSLNGNYSVRITNADGFVDSNSAVVVIPTQINYRDSQVLKGYGQLVPILGHLQYNTSNGAYSEVTGSNNSGGIPEWTVSGVGSSSSSTAWKLFNGFSGNRSVYGNSGGGGVDGDTQNYNELVISRTTAVTVDMVRIFGDGSEASLGRRMRLSGSSNGSSWTTIKDFDVNTALGSHTQWLDSPVAYRFFRLTTLHRYYNWVTYFEGTLYPFTEVQLFDSVATPWIV